MDQADLGASLLAPLREVEPGPESTVSLRRAVRVGGRRRRTRQVLAVVVIACVTALVVVAVPAVVSGQSMNEPAGEFDPVRQEFQVGSAGGFTPAGYATGRYRQRVVLRPVDGDGPQATIELYARGRTPPPDGDPAPDVNGRRALWVPGPQAGVAWEWADGAWAFASVPAGVGEARAKAHRIAQSVEHIPR